MIFPDFCAKRTPTNTRSVLRQFLRAACLLQAQKKVSGHLSADLLFCETFGRQVGFEPTTHGTTIRYSNQLSYNRHLVSQKDAAKIHFFWICATLPKFFFFCYTVCPKHATYLQRMLNKSCINVLKQNTTRSKINSYIRDLFKLDLCCFL